MTLTQLEISALIMQAQEVLRKNWRDGYTIPSPTLYPFQWLWDSGFIALGYFYFDLEKAQSEIRSLFKGQWKNGMVPHIIFHKEDENYFPGPAVWGSHLSPNAPVGLPTTGITQPPVIGFILEMMYQNAADKNTILPFIKEMFPKVLAFHRYLYRFRDPGKEGLIHIIHNWESGMDNAPLWDAALQRIEVDDTRDLSKMRRDVKNVEAEVRPSDAEYRRYLYLVELFKKYRYDDERITKNCPFLIQTPLFNSILVRSNLGLIKLAKILGVNSSEIEDWNTLTVNAMNTKLWDAQTQSYQAYDLVADAPIPNHMLAAIAGPLFAEIPDQQRAKILIAKLQREFTLPGFYKCPSYNPNGPEFEPQRYWRGPVWINMNWMLYHGLKNYGETNLAAEVKSDSIELLSNIGFFEYFDPRKNVKKGYGGDYFSWSAALFLDWMSAPGKNKESR